MQHQVITDIAILVALVIALFRLFRLTRKRGGDK